MLSMELDGVEEGKGDSTSGPVAISKPFIHKRRSLLDLPSSVLLEVGWVLVLGDYWDYGRMAERGVERWHGAHDPAIYELAEPVCWAWGVLRALSEVCRRLRRALQPLMWQHVKINLNIDAAVAAILHGVARHHVQSVALDMNDLGKIEHFIGLFPNLRVVCLFPLSRKAQIHSTSLMRSMRTLHLAAANSLETLQLGGHFNHSSGQVFWSLSPFQMPQIPLFGSLRSLHFRTKVVPGDDAEMERYRASEELYGRLVLAGRCPKLQRLHMSVGAACWPAGAELSRLAESWVAPIDDFNLDLYNQPRNASAGFWDVLNIVRDTLETLEIDGAGAAVPPRGMRRFPKLKYLKAADSSWEAALTAMESVLTRSRLQELKLHDSHFLFDDDEALYDGLEPLHIRFLSCLRRTRRLVKKHRSTLHLINLDVHWAHRPAFDRAVLVEVKEDFEAMVGGLCRELNIGCHFTIHP